MTLPRPPPISLCAQGPYLGSQVTLHLHHEMQQVEALLHPLTVNIGARAGVEPRLVAEVHIVDNEAVSTGVCVQDVCLPKHRDQCKPGSRCTPRERRRPPGFHSWGRQSGEMGQSMQSASLRRRGLGSTPSIPD